MGFGRRASRIHGGDASRLSCRDHPVAFVHTREECPRFLLKTVLVVVFAAFLACTVGDTLVALAGAPHALRRIGVEQDGQIRL